ncbi:hypothetical protein J31TS4_47380 [Paenibacillus sp. J31TS4]|uniref:stage II sporulation protein M n=1 Tax=Paenibacillus sp. J31TS4 TaxID=2807195 RepID=UPI001AFF3EA6|nr:stage II sporulation protein M [Paenibacillus sp. J31TS4]GIP41458.1 hypothetical protein J31TS4_47380 [Paenibacillus sp. J31TS4]
MSFRALWRQMGTMKHYFVASALVFLAGAMLGYLNPDGFEAIMRDKMDQLKEVIAPMLGGQTQHWKLVGFIFLNNTLLSILMIYLGAAFGLLPLYFLMSNGLMLGYLASANTNAAQWISFLKAIVPHGIIEIPTVIAASAFGLRFGFLTLEAFGSLFSSKRRLALRPKVSAFLRSTVPMCGLVIVLLAVAALIEGIFTFWLVTK